MNEKAQIIPAIDLKQGKCVRLKKGDFQEKEKESGEKQKKNIKRLI